MAAGTPSEIAQRWQQGMAGAGNKIRAGVQAVTTSPTQKAAAAGQTWLARLNDPATLAKYQASLNRVTLQDWQNNTLQKGLQRIAAGATAAQPKFETFMTQFLPFVQSVAARVKAMPKASLEDRINRMVAQVRGVAGFKRQ